MLPPVSQSHALECPKCGKHSIVQHKSDVYCCLNCGFRRDLSHGNLEGLGLVATTGLAVLVILVLL